MQEGLCGLHSFYNKRAVCLFFAHEVLWITDLSTEWGQPVDNSLWEVLPMYGNDPNVRLSVAVPLARQRAPELRLWMPMQELTMTQVGR